MLFLSRNFNNFLFLREKRKKYYLNHKHEKHMMNILKNVWKIKSKKRITHAPWMKEKAPLMMMMTMKILIIQSWVRIYHRPIIIISDLTLSKYPLRYVQASNTSQDYLSIIMLRICFKCIWFGSEPKSRITRTQIKSIMPNSNLISFELVYNITS